jgi:hypothetical protein
LKTYKRINPENKPLTIEKLKEFKGFENLTEAEALNIVDSIQKLAIIHYEIYKHDIKPEQP